MKKRKEEIDLIKALGIILIVAGHGGFPFSSFINYFHVAVFFIASGYTYRSIHSEDLRSLFDYIKRKLQLLLFPYFLCNAIFSLFHNFLIQVNIYTTKTNMEIVGDDSAISITKVWGIKEILENIAKGLFFRGDNDLLQGIWFIKDLLLISILYCIIDFLLHRLNAERKAGQLFISILLLFTGFICHKSGFLGSGIARILSYYSLYHMGTMLNLHEERIKEKDDRLHLAFLILPFLILSVFSYFGLSVSLVKHRYYDPFFLLIISLLGWILLWEISSFILKTDKFKDILLILGKKSYIILLLHILSFKIITLLRIRIDHLSINLLSSIPAYKGEEKGWWLAYTVIGCLLPVIYSSMKDQVFKKIRKGI